MGAAVPGPVPLVLLLAAVKAKGCQAAPPGRALLCVIIAALPLLGAISVLPFCAIAALLLVLLGAIAALLCAFPPTLLSTAPFKPSLTPRPE